MNRNGKVGTWAEVYRKFEGRCNTKRVKASSMDQYRRTMGWFCEWADNLGIAPAELEPLDVIEYLGNLRQLNGEPYSINSQLTHSRDVKTLINFCADYGLIPQHIKVEMPKADQSDIKALTDEEIERVLGYFKDRSEQEPRDLAICFFLLDTGVRAAELCGLNWADLTWNEENGTGKARISKQLNRKGELVPIKNNKPRDVYFSRRTWEALRVLLIGRGLIIKTEAKLIRATSAEGPGELSDHEMFERLGPVFLSFSAWSAEAGRLTTSGLRWIFEEASKATGVHLHPHLLRHTAGRLMTIKEMPPMAIKAILGHSSLQMVEHYSRLWGRDVEDLFARKMNGS